MENSKLELGSRFFNKEEELLGQIETHVAHIMENLRDIKTDERGDGLKETIKERLTAILLCKDSIKM